MADDVLPVMTAADTVDVQQGMFSRLYDAATKGISTAAMSGGLSVYNTFLDYTGKEAVDTAKTIQDYDVSYGDYYQDHKDTIDLAGFVGTSFIPGGAAIKGLKLAQAGEAVGPISRALSLTSSRQAFYLDKALAELGRSGGTVTAAVTNAKRAQLAWAVADQTLQSAAAELAVVATMNDSPIFEGQDAWDFTKNVAVGAVFGGVVGGLLEHAGTRGILKQAQLKIEGNRRAFDTIFDPAKMGLQKGDETLLFAENIVNLSTTSFKAAEDTASILEKSSKTFAKNTYKEGDKYGFISDVEGAFGAIRTRAEKVGFDNLALKFNELAEGGEVTGQAMFKFVVNKIKSARDEGKSSDIITDEINGYLQGVKKISNIVEEDKLGPPPKQFFINDKPTGLGDLFSEVYGGEKGATGKTAYYLTTNDPRQMRFGSVARLGYENAEEAFADGYDAVLTKAGKVSVNPKSQVIKRTPDMALGNKYFLDLQTGGLSPEVVLTGADLVKKADDFKWSKDRVVIKGKIYNQAESVATDMEAGSLAHSTRFMWASKLEDAAFKNRVIDASDFALLDRANLLPNSFKDSNKLSIKLADGRDIPFSDIIDSGQYINQLKLDWLKEFLGKEAKGYDVRKLSAATNTTRQWVEDAIASNFEPSKQLLQQTQSLSKYFEPQTVALEWDKTAKQIVDSNGASIGPNHLATTYLGHEYALLTRERVANNAFESVFGEDAQRFLDAPKDLSSQVSERGAGASLLGASNADYGRQAELLMQDTGKQLSLVAQKWRDKDIGALAPYINAVRDSLESSAELGVLTTALRRDARKYYLDSSEEAVAGSVQGKKVYRLVDREAVALFEKGSFNSLDESIDYIKAQSTTENRIRGSYSVTNSQTGEFLEASTSINAARVQKQTTLLNASGIARELDSRVVYVPPVDTKRYPFFAFVKAKERIGAATDLAMITAKDENQLRQLASKVGDEYEVIFKQDTNKFFKAQGSYDYQLQINESSVNSALQKKGILGDFFPETRGQNVLEDYVRWHGNSSDSLVRMGVQVKNRQFFSELESLSEQFQSASTSATKGIGLLKKQVADPFQDYIKTGLGISKQSEFPLMNSLNEFVDKIGTKAYTALDNFREEFTGSKGKDLVSLESANKLIEDTGLGTPYKTMEDYLLANEKFPKNLIKQSFQKANMWLATTVLRFDFANSIINTISTPMMLGTELASIKTLIEKNPELVGKLALLTTTQVPGQTYRMPSLVKLTYNGIKNFWGADKEALIARYDSIGVLPGNKLNVYHEVIDDLAYKTGLTPSAWNQKIDAAIEKGATITGNNLSEQLTRFISADAMRQLTDPLVAAGKMDIKEQNAYISSFVNRVQGNYISSQRPIVFQGTTGAAVGLFQTYAFNVLQQLFRHVENGDKRAVLTFAGLQSSLYGFNGLPFFDAINQHLIGSASGNAAHQDAYSALPAANKEIGDWLLYGTASAFPLFGEKSPALYTRGDINPRHLSILPTNPLDIPAVSASIKLVGSIVGFGQQVAQGADLSSSFLQALEHHGWNRPLAGFAQVLAGKTTTGKGSLISASNDLETTSFLAKIPARMIEFGGVARLMGSRPMDEAVALNSLYRNKAYEAMDRARIDALGQAVKTKLSNNQMPDDEDLEGFMKEYAKSGGRIETFSSSMQRWSRDANTSIVNQMAQKTGSSYGKKLQMIMGGEQLQDYSSIANQSNTTEGE